MKILFLLQDFPYPPLTGFHWKAYNLIKYMAKNNECHILSFGDSNAQQRAIEFSRILPKVWVRGIFPTQKGINLNILRLTNIIKGLPFSLARYKSKDFTDAFRKALQSEKYDLIHYDMINMAQFFSIGQSLPSVLSPNDAFSLAYQRSAKQKGMLSLRKIILQLSSRLLCRFERNVYPNFLKVHVVSPVDYKHIRSISPKINLELIELAVGDEFYKYQNNISRNSDSRYLKLLFTGSFRNPGILRGLLDFLKLSYPMIIREFRHIQLIILGRNAPLSLLKYLKKLDKVNFLPWVEDYINCILNADVVIFPDKSGTGIKTRVLQSMALAKPIVASPIALEGIAIQDRVHCLVNKNPDKFAQSVITLLKDPKLRKQIGMAARDLIFKRYNMDIIGPKWLELYQQAIHKFR